MNKSIIIDPIELFLWTFRRNENDVVKLYNKLSDVMRLATGGNMLNFGYWTEKTRDPIQAQIELCNVFGRLAELETAKKVVDVGSGLSAPSIQWKSQYDFLEITCLNINFNQLKSSSDIIKKASENPNSLNDMYLLNATSTKLPIQNDSVDRVLALESAQHMKPLGDFITESKRILKKDGIFALAIPIVKKEIIPIVKLGILSMTWPSEHYDMDYVKSSLTKHGFDIIEIKKIGSMVYKPLAKYYIDNRNSIRNKILTKYPSYVEKILFKSLLKMKHVSETNVIDYLLIKCKK
ncbi:MAG: Type 11 methyltransferase [Nitrosopumilales archaeon]|nr:MAG: Type 11 methyltransferase [Nitrosopumilales archaeon]